MYEKLKLTPGLLTLRYAKPAAGEANAVIRPIVPLASRHAIRLMFEPDNLSGALFRPDEICVIRCSKPAVLVLEIASAEGTGAPNGSVELDYLAQTAPEPDTRSAADILVYLDRHGDKPAKFGTWVGADEPGHPIAGLMLHPRASGPRILLRDPISGQIAAPGEYLGSSGGFRPLSELQAWIEDPDGRHHLHLSAEFARAGLAEATGTLVTLHGAGPEDALLRLNLQVKPLGSAKGRLDLAATQPSQRDRVRIFRKS